MLGALVITLIFAGLKSALLGIGLLLAGFVIIPLFYTLVVSRTYSDWPLRLALMIAFSCATLALLFWLFDQ